MKTHYRNLWHGFQHRHAAKLAHLELLIMDFWVASFIALLWYITARLVLLGLGLLGTNVPTLWAEGVGLGALGGVLLALLFAQGASRYE